MEAALCVFDLLNGGLIMEESPKRPGGELSGRPLHFIWIADCSGSMSVNGKIQTLNTAIREALPAMRKVSGENPHAEVLVRAIKFSDGAMWHIGVPTPVDQFQWKDLSSSGCTDMGKALKLVADELQKLEKAKLRGLPPVLVLISDGQPTDDFEKGLEALLNQPWGIKAVRIGIGIGKDANLDILRKFINNPEFEPLEAKNADALIKYIRWVTTSVLKAASAPPSQPHKGASAANVPIPKDVPQVSANDIW